MPLAEAEDAVARLTDPRTVNSEPEVEDGLIKTFQADVTVLAHSLRFLAHKVQSPCEREALRSLTLLDNLVKRGGRIIQAEVGKFRFLNELIKVVSPKYLGERTTEAVKKKTTEALYAWTLLVRHEQKIVEAYAMLKQQGIVRDDPTIFEPTPPPPPRPKNPIIEDEERAKLLRRLLQSKDPTDMVAANRLIKSMVREDDQRTEKIVRRHSDLTQIKENANLLLEMMKHYTPELCSIQEHEIMRQLFDSCEQHRPRVFKLAAEIAESNTETEEGPNLADILTTSDELTEAIQRFRALGLSVDKSDDKKLGDRQQSAADLVAIESSESASGAFAGGLPNSDGASKISTGGKDDIFSLFDDVFTTSNASLPAAIPLVASTSGTNLSTLPSAQAAPIVKIESKVASPPNSRKSLVDFDAVTHSFLGGLSLGDMNMKGRAFPIESKPKVSLIELQRGLPFGSGENQQVENNLVRASTSGDDEMLREKSNTFLKEMATNSLQQNGDVQPPTSLDNISISLQDIEPASTASISVYQRNKVNIVLHLARNKPRSDCTVLFAATTSQNSTPLKNFSLSLSVPKTMRIKVHPTVLSDIPAFNPIFPAHPISQIIIIAGPTKEAIRLQYKVSYMLDGQTICDSGDVPNIPEI